jgi:calcium-dependent protein kinase
VRVLELLENDTDYYIVMELMPDGNLLDFLNNISLKKISFTESDAANLCNQIVLALSYMHGIRIVHRDLKLENIMIQRMQPEQNEVVVKLTDFGFACTIDPEKGETLSLGSPMYTAPEVIRMQSYDSRCDVWSLGVMTYMMLTGRPPFSG